MYSLNRKTRYQIIKELIKRADPDIIKNIIIDSNFYERVKNYGFSIDINTDDIEYRRLELIHYLDEMENDWEEHYTDMTDRQFIKIK